MKLLRHTWSACGWCTRGACTVVVWTLWLALTVLFCLQLWCLTSRELALPDFVRRALEQRLAASELQATFGRTTFDPSGRVLIENIALSAPGFSEPIAAARMLYVRLDPWALLARNFEPLELHASGVELFVPAMVSASGRAEALVHDVDLRLRPRGNQIVLEHVTGRVGPLAVTARGSVQLGPWERKRDAPLPLADLISRHYPKLSQRLAEHVKRLEMLKEPRLELTLTPSAAQGASVDAVLFSQAAAWERPVHVSAHNVRLATRFPLQSSPGAPITLELSADQLDLPRNTNAVGVTARLNGTWQPGQRRFRPSTIEGSARTLSAEGFDLTSWVAQATLDGQQVRGSLAGALAGERLAVTGGADFGQRSGAFHVESRIAPGLLALISARTKRDLGALLQLSTPPELVADVRLGPGWKYESGEAHIAARNLGVRRVPLDSIRGRVSYAGNELRATDVVLHQSANVARGSYTMDTATRDYRFLLTGRLRPLEIAGWFREWWPNLFANFDFSAAPPDADVDVRGRWGAPQASTVMLGIAAREPVIRSVPFDHVTTRLFIRPQFQDGLQFSATRGSGSAQGTFQRRSDLQPGGSRTVDFEVTSTLELQHGARLFGQMGLDVVKPFQFETPPRLKLEGKVDTGVETEPRYEVHLEGDSVGRFVFHDFPLSNLVFVGDVKNRDITLDRVEVNFADGAVFGRARVWGQAPDRRVGFDLALHHGNLAEAIITVENFAALRRQAPPPAKSAFLEKADAVRLDLAVSAEGLYNDLYSYHGSGNATLEGAELGQVRLLGLLSDLLRFTSLRFTAARANFNVKGPHLEFPEVKLTGTTSMIDARGTYLLDKKELDFTAKAFPFGESKFILPNIVGAVLSPLSQVLEVKLTGPLAKPEWAFVLGPTNFFRSLTRPTEPANPPSPAASQAPLLSPYLKR